jgi:RNA-directed DNA polymerase
MVSHRLPFAIANLASEFLAGRWTLRSMVARGKAACPHGSSAIRAIVRRVRVAHPEPPPPDMLGAWLQADALAAKVCLLGTGRCYFLEPRMTPRGAAAKAWQTPALTNAPQLAEWLEVSLERLDWLADVRGWTTKQPGTKLRHYVPLWQPRRHGRFRLIESPKPALKRIQRKVLHHLLAHIPPHPAAHGFRPGRSIVSYAAPHVGRRIVLRFDLRDFFPSVRAGRIRGVFRTAGYPEEVARLLAGLCTTRMPLDVWESRPDPQPSDERTGERLRTRHLPQGAPTSPALANLCARRLDARLSGLAAKCEAVYTRYADDLAFSGGDMLARNARRFQTAVAVIAAEEGFDLHFQKSRFMRRGVRQQLAGIVVNDKPNIRRAAYDELKAILTNCRRHGPASQNRAGRADFRGYLLGRIAFVAMVHPQRGAKLRDMFSAIAW